MKRIDDSNVIYRNHISTKTQQLIFWALVAITFVLIFILNKVFPLYSDDYLYSFIYKLNPPIRINSFNDILCSQINHYFEWGGRSVVHAIAQLLLWIGIGWGDILNSLAYIIFLFIIYLFCNKGHPVNPLLFLILVVVIWLFLPTPTETILWITGSANYLWGTLIVLLFLFSYYSFYRSRARNKENILKTILFFIGGIISGWTNENIFIAQVFFILCIFILYKKQNTNIPAWAISGLIGVCIGGGIMLLAPGNFIRSEIINTSLGLDNKSLFENIIYRVGKVIYRYLVYILPITILYLITFCLYTKKTNRDSSDKTIITTSLLFFVSAHIAWIVMCASPIFPPRATFSIITFIVIGLGILYANMIFEKKLYRLLNLISITVLVTIFAIAYMIEYRSVQSISSVFKQREDFLIKQREKGNRDIIFDTRIPLSKRYQLEDLSDNPQKGYNKAYANYYDVDSVRILQSSNIKTNAEDRRNIKE